MRGTHSWVIEVSVAVRASEWRAMHREALRLGGLRRRLLLLALALAGTGVGAAALRSHMTAVQWPDVVILGATGAALVAVLVFGVIYPAVAGQLLWWKLPADQRSTQWQAAPEGLLVHGLGRNLEVSWYAVARLVIARTVLIVDLGRAEGVVGLPRWVLDVDDLSRLAGWAHGSGADVRRRRRA